MTQPPKTVATLSCFGRLNQDCVDIIVEFAAAGVDTALGLRDVARSLNMGVRNLVNSVLRISGGDVPCDEHGATPAPRTIEAATLEHAQRVFGRSDSSSPWRTVLLLAVAVSEPICAGIDLPKPFATDLVFSRVAQILGPRARHLRLSAANPPNPSKNGSQVHAQPIKSVTDVGVAAVATHCPNLRSLHLTNRTKRTAVTDVALVAIATGCPTLEEVVVPCVANDDFGEDWDDANDDDELLEVSIKGISERGLLALAEHCQMLRVLDVSGAATLRSTGICRVAQACPNITVLRVAGTSVDDDGIVNCAPHLSNLHTIDVSRNRGRVTDIGIRAIAVCCPKLTVFAAAGSKPSYYGDGTITDHGLAAVAAKCPQLQELDVSDSAASVTDEGLIAIAEGCPDLRKLNVGGTSVGNAAVRHIAKHCTKLADLRFGGRSDIGDEGVLCVLERCNGLRYVHLGRNITWECESQQLCKWAHVVMVRDM